MKILTANRHLISVNYMQYSSETELDYYHNPDVNKHNVFYLFKNCESVICKSSPYEHYIQDCDGIFQDTDYVISMKPKREKLSLFEKLMKLGAN